MDKESFIAELRKLKISINKEQLEKLNTYYKMLLEYNKHTNLTRIIEEEEVYLKHFYDSITLIKIIELNNQKLLDIGTGAGFPGLVLKIVFPKLKVTLVDSLNKRIIFLKQVIEKLNLKEIKVVHARAEDYIENNRESFDIVTSRAVANLRILSELCLPFVKINGFFVPMKAEASEEIENSKMTINTLGGEIKDIITFNLPKDSGKRTLIKIAKNVKTNSKYPRKFSEIRKKPL